jgi:hypothetical protein
LGESKMCKIIRCICNSTLPLFKVVNHSSYGHGMCINLSAADGEYIWAEIIAMFGYNVRRLIPTRLRQPHIVCICTIYAMHVCMDVLIVVLHVVRLLGYIYIYIYSRWHVCQMMSTQWS